ncbi:MAG: nucleotide disphospho-sugar-binding domain-containing protein [Cyanobacteria bacterium P01_G01_bin.54]
MTHFGIISVASAGPLNTMLPLGQELQRRGHSVTLIAIADAATTASAANIAFHAVGSAEFPLGSVRAMAAELGELQGWAAIRYTSQALSRMANVLLSDAPAIAQEVGIEALLVNQGAFAGGTLADRLQIPFITVCSAAVMNREPDVPPCGIGWIYQPVWWARWRNQVGYWVSDLLVHPLRQTVAQYRRDWQLPLYPKPDAENSSLAQISQVPTAFEFPRPAAPPYLHFTGPFHTTASRAPIPFPWDGLDRDRPLVYASMGTLQNRLLWVFEVIAAACADLEVQLVLSLGGATSPETLPPLPGQPLVVAYAPQLELLQQTTLAIIHAGMNTTMECLMQGVPMVAIPVTNDQPGVAARIVWSGVGERVPLHRLNPPKLRRAVQTVLTDPVYKENALRLQAACHASGGVKRAADIVERAIATRQPVLANPPLI